MPTAAKKRYTVSVRAQVIYHFQVEAADEKEALALAQEEDAGDDCYSSADETEYDWTSAKVRRDKGK